MFVRDRHEGELEWLRADSFNWDNLPRPICVINGCFDILHSGHMRCIFHAREHCKTLICAMDSDRLIREKKPLDSNGVARPILNWIERATTLGYMPIDYLVEIDSDKEMDDFLRRTRPDFRLQGAEYRDVPTRFPWLKKLYVRSQGMRTSEIIKRIRENTLTNE